MDLRWACLENDCQAMVVSASEQPSDSRWCLHVPHAYVAQAVVGEHCEAQEPPFLLHHLRSHWSRSFPHGYVFVRIFARARLEELISVVVVDQRRDRHYFLVLQARWGVLSQIQSACAGGRKETRGTRTDQTTFFLQHKEGGEDAINAMKKGESKESSRLRDVKRDWLVNFCYLFSHDRSN